MTDTYDLVIDQHLSQNTERNDINSIDDTQIIKMYKNKIERKRGRSIPQQTTKFNVSRDFQVVFVKDPKKNQNQKINRLIKMLDPILKRRLIFGIRKMKENRLAKSKQQSQWSISQSDGKMPIDYKKMVEAFDDLDALFKRKNQLLLVLGFIKISYEQKEIMKKRQNLIRNLSCMRIQRVFSILKDCRLQKRSKGTQVQLLNQIPCESVIQKIDSTGTIFLDSFISKDKAKTFNNPFSKIKSDGVELTTFNMEDSKVSETSFQTINLKMNKLQNIIKEARQIRQSHNYKKRYSTQFIDQIQDKKRVSATDLIHSCSQIKSCDSPNKKTKKNLNIRNFNNRKEIFQNNDKTNQNPKYNAFQQQTKRLPKYSSPTNKTSSIKTKIHQIVQPVIQQVIQPIHYYHVPVYSFRQKSSSSIYEPQDVQYVKQTIYRPVFKHKSPDFSRVYPSTPNHRNVWF